MTQLTGDKTECEIIGLLDEFNIVSPLRDYFIVSTEFHSYPAPGMLIGVFMVDLALEVLNVGPKDRLYAVSETKKCAPDPLQVILHCTIGNNRLRIIETGRFAIALNLGSKEEWSRGAVSYTHLTLPTIYSV